MRGSRIDRKIYFFRKNGNAMATQDPKRYAVFRATQKNNSNEFNDFIILAEKHSPTVDKYKKDGECL